MPTTAKQCEDRFARGICTSCPNPVKPGHKRCEACLRKCSELNRKLAKSRVAKGLCVRGCGRPICGKSKVRCEECMVAHREHTRGRYVRKTPPKVREAEPTEAEIEATIAEQMMNLPDWWDRESKRSA